MKFKHVKMLSENKAEIRLYDTIGTGGLTGERIASEIEFLIEFAEVEEILVRINSGGGCMVEGFGIFSALQSATDKGIKVVTQNDGLAASMATPILAAGSERRMVDFGLIMLHDPSIDASLSDKIKAMLKKFKEAAIKMFTGKTNLSESELDSMMTKETWLDAKEALEMGFITEIVATGKTISSQIKASHNVNNLIGVYNSIINGKVKTKPVKKMKKIALELGLPEDATQEQILAAMKASKKDDNSQSHIEVLLSLGRKNGVVNDKNIEYYRTLATDSYDTTASLLSIEDDAAAASGEGDEEHITMKGLIDEVKKLNTKGGEAENDSDKSKWSFDRLQKEDSAYLLEMKNTNPEKYKKLALAHSGK